MIASPVPDDGLGALERLQERGLGRGADVQAHPAVGDAGLDGGGADLGIFGELVGGAEILREVDLHALGLRLLHQLPDDLGSFFVVQGAPDLAIRRREKRR